MQNYPLHFPDVFADSVATQIWQQYKERIERVLKPLPLLQKQDILLEIQSHIWESVEHDSAQSEAEKVLNATRKLGHPEEFLQPVVGKKLLENASHTLNPAVLAQSLYYMIGGSRIQSILVLVMSLLYTILFVLALMVCLKFVFPHNVGLFAGEAGGFAFGFFDYSNLDKKYYDVFGYWFVPLGLAVCVLLYTIVTKIAYRIVQSIVTTTIASDENL